MNAFQPVISPDPTLPDDQKFARGCKKPGQLLILRHSPIDGPGHLTEYFRRCGWETQFFDAPSVDFDAIDPLKADLVLSLGSGLSVYDRNLFPFIGKELEFLQRRLTADRPTLGICFGAQMMAAALGARVFKAKQSEIGWFPLELTIDGVGSPLQHLAPEVTPAVMHWHQDTFELPKGTRRLARSDLCEIQAFDQGKHILALQFHPEITARGIEDWLCESSFPSDTRATQINQIRADTARFQAIAQSQTQKLLDDWLAQLAD